MSEIKKGRPSWKPASNKLNVVKKVAGFRYRWCDKDEMNIEKKKAEGWEHVNKTTGIPGESGQRSDVPDGKSLDSTQKYRELELMALPEEVAQERDRHFQELTDKQTVGLKKTLEDDLKKSGFKGGLHGKITIE